VENKVDLEVLKDFYEAVDNELLLNSTQSLNLWKAFLKCKPILDAAENEEIETLKAKYESDDSYGPNYFT
jgi:hypothetical protein